MSLGSDQKLTCCCLAVMYFLQILSEFGVRSKINLLLSYRDVCSSNTQCHHESLPLYFLDLTPRLSKDYLMKIKLIIQIPLELTQAKDSQTILKIMIL
jgi:hypothetical protein